MGVPVARPDGRVLARAGQPAGRQSRHGRQPRGHVDGPELEATADVICAVAGAVFELNAGGRDVPMHAAVRAAQRPASALWRQGARARARPWPCEAASTCRRSSAAARPIWSAAWALRRPCAESRRRAADRDNAGDRSRRDPRRLPLPLPDGGAQLRVMAGPQEDRFTADAYRHTVRLALHDHAGVQPDGLPSRGAAARARRGADILSDATPLGSIQVPASGQPILLMADRQTTGGYPKIAAVITADMPIAGQLAPGDWIEFAAVHARRGARRAQAASTAASEQRGERHDALADRLRELSAMAVCSAMRRWRR